MEGFTLLYTFVHICQELYFSFCSVDFVFIWMFMVWLVVLYGADQGLVLITRLKPVTTANVKSHGKRSVICVTRLLKSTIFKFFITVTPITHSTTTIIITIIFFSCGYLEQVPIEGKSQQETQLSWYLCTLYICSWHLYLYCTYIRIRSFEGRETLLYFVFTLVQYILAFFISTRILVNV